jgi:hypothetical protein
MYRTKVTIGHDETGKPIHKWIQAATQKKLDEEKRRIREIYIEGAVAAKDELFGSYCVQWYKARKLPTLAPATAKRYRSVLNVHVLPAFGDRNLRAIRPLELQAYINKFAGCGETQINNVLAILHGVFRSAVQDQIISRDPTVGLVPPEAAEVKEKRALTPEEAAIVERLRGFEQALEEGTFLDDYRARLVWLGQPVRVIRGEDVREATALSVDRYAALRVRYADGSEEDLVGGEISLRLQ